MKNIAKRYRSALVIQMMLAQIQATYSIHLIERNFHHQYGRNSHEDPRFRNIYHYIPQPEDLFLRTAKSANQPRMLSIDLSGLRHDKDIPVSHSNSRHKSPLNLLGIDVSVLSRNPDPSLPIAIVHPKNILNGKSIMSYDFDQKYDRLPVIKAKPVRTYASVAEKPTKIVPVMHLPLKVMTTYHSILTNKKQDIDFQFDSESSNDAEREQNYTANFILHLLYQLSSNYKKPNSD